MRSRSQFSDKKYLELRWLTTVKGCGESDGKHFDFRTMHSIYFHSLRDQVKSIKSLYVPEYLVSILINSLAAAGWGSIFTTGLTIMGLHFQRS